VFYLEQKTYPLPMELDKPMAKVGLISFVIAAWVTIIQLDSGWFSLIFIAPMTGLVMLILSAALGIIEWLLRWINK
jgi:hypothetical protein